jgi:Flp pilus assembly protein TadG
MRGPFLARLIKSRSAAVAPTVALSLFGLIAVGGVAFDYSRMATLDTELQTAADQAALAAATQLDGEADAMTRATAAAKSLITNRTLFANDKAGTNITISTPLYYQDKARTVAATNDGNANFVLASVVSRTANFAFTPIVAAFSGNMTASAFAGTETAVCGVVPFFICNPSEPVGNTNSNYPVSIGPGIGIQMLEGGQQKGPGNYGFLAYAGRGAANLEEALSTDKVYSECITSNSVETEEGQKTSVFNGLNRRFDLAVPCSHSPCSTSTNEVKDLVREAGACNWKENPATSANFRDKRYRPVDASTYVTATPEIMGHPRDRCHAVSKAGNCAGGQIGDGVWDRGAYFRSNHPEKTDWATDPELGANVTRYQTYIWEARDPANRLKPKASSTSGWSAYGTPQSSPPVCNPPGLDPIHDPIDRRILTAAVINCRAYGKINGRKTLPVVAYMSVFLVEPSIARKTYDGGTALTDNTDIYVEVINSENKKSGPRTIANLIE